MHSLAKYVSEGKVCFVRASEIQERVPVLGRDVAAASYGILSDSDGNRLVFVQSYFSKGKKVTEHFRHEDGVRDEESLSEHLSEHLSEPLSEHLSRPSPRASDARLRALELLRDRAWTVSQWCCQRRRRAHLWRREEGSRLELDHSLPVPGWGQGVVRVPVALFRPDGSLSLAVHFSHGNAPSALAAHRLPHCRLDPAAVLLCSEGKEEMDLCNLDDGDAACSDCLASDAEALRREVERGRRGVRDTLDLTPYGERFCLVPDDPLLARRRDGRVLVSLEASTRVVGTLRDGPRAPKGWKIHVTVRRPDPYAPPVHVRWERREQWDGNGGDVRR
jgi:hypothetical protein